jgi:RNA polymerase primary sigma factor
VVTSLGLSRENILKRMPSNLRTLQSVLTASTATFKTLRRTTSVSGRQRVRRTLQRQLRKAIRLVEELSPRTELLERLSEDLVRWSERLSDLEQEIARCGRSAADRERQTRLVKELRDLTQEARTTPEELTALLRVLGKRHEI